MTTQKGEIVFVSGDIYQGQMLGGKPHGQGLYTFADRSHYKGQFKQGIFHGQGTLVHPFSNITIKGQFIQGITQGNCKVEYADGSQYEGQMKDGLRNGKGIFTFASGAQQKEYRGMFQEDQFNGQGQLSFKDGSTIYRGKFIQGQLSGNDCQIVTAMYSYVGSVIYGIIEGKGSIRYTESGDLYEGTFKNNLKDGHGKYTYGRCGSTFKGQFSEDQRKGKGKINYHNGDWFQGYWEGDQCQGYGLWRGWDIQGAVKEGGNTMEGTLKMKKDGKWKQMNIQDGKIEGGINMGIKVKSEEVKYRGDFQQGRQKPYSVNYSSRV